MSVDYSRIRGGNITMQPASEPGIVSVRLRAYSKTWLFRWPEERLFELGIAIADYLSEENEVERDD